VEFNCSTLNKLLEQHWLWQIWLAHGSVTGSECSRFQLDIYGPGVRLSFERINGWPSISTASVLKYIVSWVGPKSNYFNFNQVYREKF